MSPPKIFGNRSAKFLRKNGELLLRKRISFQNGERTNPIRTFTLRDLQQATLNFDDSRRLEDPYENQTFYDFHWGVLDGFKIVVLSKTPWDGLRCDAHDLVESTITEIVILSTIRHRNVVTLLGCCLETEVPLLVYQFVPGESLARSMNRYDWRVRPPLPWSSRLQIVIDVADALAYLHSYTSRPIIHRQVAPDNIRLGEDNIARLTGFGHLCDLIPPGETQIEDVIIGKFGYLDPEYLMRSTLTEKTDIYGLGVVLFRLLTGRRSQDLYPIEGEDVLEQDGLRNLTIPTEGNIEEHVEFMLAQCGHAPGDAAATTEQFRAFAELSCRCVRPRRQDRPTMKEVVEELIRIKM